jgi:hypothetical protein
MVKLKLNEGQRYLAKKERKKFVGVTIRDVKKRG